MRIRTADNWQDLLEEKEEEAWRDPTLNRKPTPKVRPRPNDFKRTLPPPPPYDPYNHKPPNPYQEVHMGREYFTLAVKTLEEQIKTGKVDKDLEGYVKAPFKFIPSIVTFTTHIRQRYYQRNDLKAVTPQDIKKTDAEAYYMVTQNPKVKRDTHLAVKNILEKAVPLSLKTSTLIGKIHDHEAKDGKLKPIRHVSNGKWVCVIVEDDPGKCSVVTIMPVGFFHEDELSYAAKSTIPVKVAQFEEDDFDIQELQEEISRDEADVASAAAARRLNVNVTQHPTLHREPNLLKPA